MTKCYKCEHEWEYKGKSIYYLTCPNCYYKISIARLNSIEEGRKALEISKELNEIELIPEEKQIGEE